MASSTLEQTRLTTPIPWASCTRAPGLWEDAPLITPWSRSTPTRVTGRTSYGSRAMSLGVLIRCATISGSWRSAGIYRPTLLDIQLHTLVTNIRFDTSGETPKATGVELLWGQSLYGADPLPGTADEGTPGSVDVLKEVIISGGTLNSPQLLMLSSIGPKDVLDRVGVSVLVDSPGVGTNMQGHATVSRTPTPF